MEAMLFQQNFKTNGKFPEARSKQATLIGQEKASPVAAHASMTKSFFVFLFGLARTGLVGGTTTFCPTAQDMNIDYGNEVSFDTTGSAGWTIAGSGRVSSKTSFDLLGGSITFTMDVSNVADAVNTNFYTSSPPVPNTGSDTYCDIQLNPGCMELDIIENNGQCGYATTLHTFPFDGVYANSDCDRWGCVTSDFLPDDKTFEVKADFSATGDVTISINGNPNSAYSPYPSHDSNDVVVSTMQSIGVVIESSMWTGWVPMDGDCPGGDGNGLSSSVLKVSNVRVEGKVVQGPQPTICVDDALTSNLRGAV